MYDVKTNDSFLPSTNGHKGEVENSQFLWMYWNVLVIFDLLYKGLLKCIPNFK